MCHIFIAFHKYEMAKIKMCKIERERKRNIAQTVRHPCVVYTDEQMMPPVPD